MRAAQQTLRQIEIIHTSLSGLALICVILLAGVLLPVFGLQPVANEMMAAIIVIAVCVGIGYLYLLNYRSHKFMTQQAYLNAVLIDSLGQGFLSFTVDGRCGPVHSQAALTLLATDHIDGRNVADLLQVPADRQGEFHEWVELLFQPGAALSFEDAARFLPDRLPRDDGRTIEISYRPVYDATRRLTRIVLIATDRTEEQAAQDRANAERVFAAMVCAIFAERQNFTLVVGELRTLLERLGRQENLSARDFFRDAHTLKGAAMHFKMEAVGNALHALEEALKTLKDTPAVEAQAVIEKHRAAIQLELGRVETAVKDLIGAADNHAQGLMEVDEEAVYHFNKLLQAHGVSADIRHAYQKSVLSVPLASLLRSLDRQLLPIADQLNKKVHPIIFTGETISMPARPLQRLLLALNHVVNNIIDHGIESPVARMAKGKNAHGEVRIHLARVRDTDGEWVAITIADDGGGVDANAVRAKLAQQDPGGPWAEEDDASIVQRLLTQEISTRDEVSMLSGRGTGMSAVYHEVVKLGGRAWLKSEMHKGTTLTLHLPERLAEAAG